MGKTTDKLYITHSEWTAEFGGAKQKQHHAFKRLPFNCCALSLQPALHPVCTSEGMVFDLSNILPWLKKHGTNPVTGQPLKQEDLTRLKFSVQNDVYSCPITFKVFTEHTKIVAIKTSGNVFSYDAVSELNIKPKFFFDLLTDVAFTKKDIITIQDPHSLELRDVNLFHYVKHEIPVDLPRPDKMINNIAQPSSLAPVQPLLELKETVTQSFVKPSKQLSAHFTDNSASMAFTSTTLNVTTNTSSLQLSEADYILTHTPKQAKAFVQIVTNFGEMNFELYAGDAPYTCYNFIQLAKSGYYNETKFHRSIPGFMLQGGDPTATGSGGESHYKHTFRDEFSKLLKHDAKGILSMANKGPNTNTSQFFITYKACPHLDMKHTVFGRQTSNPEVLAQIEQIQTTRADMPVTPVIIEKVVVFQDPFEELLVALRVKMGERVVSEKEKEERSVKRRIGILMSEKRNDESVGSVGKYIGLTKGQGGEAEATGEDKPKKLKTGFGNFDAW